MVVCLTHYTARPLHCLGEAIYDFWASNYIRRIATVIGLLQFGNVCVREIKDYSEEKVSTNPQKRRCYVD